MARSYPPKEKAQSHRHEAYDGYLRSLRLGNDHFGDLAKRGLDSLIAFVLVMLTVGYCAAPSEKMANTKTKVENSNQATSIESSDESTNTLNTTEDSASITEKANQPLSFEEYAMGYAMQICETYIKTLLLAPRSADFAFLDRRGSQDGEIVTVNSYVEAQNMYGATVQSDFVCKIRFIDKNMDNPNLEELTFSNQSILK